MFHLTIVVFLVLISDSNAKQKILNPIYWNATNSELWPKESTMNVNLFDTLPFKCPYVDKNDHNIRNLHVSIFFVDKSGYDKCDASRGMLLKKCIRPYDVIMPYNFFFTNVSSSEYTPEVHPGKTYYFISTSTGVKGEHKNLFGGLCRKSNLKLKVHVFDVHQKEHINKPEKKAAKNIEKQPIVKATQNDPSTCDSSENSDLFKTRKEDNSQSNIVIGISVGISVVSLVAMFLLMMNIVSKKKKKHVFNNNYENQITTP